MKNGKQASRPFGGVLWDLFRIIVLCALGLCAWRTRDRWLALVPKNAFFRRSAAPSLVVAGVDLSARSAAAQSGVRAVLASVGIREKHILKSVNEIRSGAGKTWLESTVEVQRPSRLEEGIFLRNLLDFLAQNHLVLMKDEKRKGQWTVELGDRERVFQRVIFR